LLVASSRIPFLEAVGEKQLLKKRFDQLSVPQRVALKCFYGCALTPEELPYWAMMQEAVTYDELGYPLAYGSVPYIPKEYEQCWALIGRRAGKTDAFGAFIVAYEATCGGHEDHRGNSQAVIFLVAQDLKLARQNLPLIYETLQTSPLLKKEIIGDPTADFIKLSNGLSIGVAPPSAKALRGYAVPVVVMDEVGFWYSDAESANPDYEVERAVEHAQAQFPHRKLVGISTPWTKEGLLWKYYEAGTEGRKLPKEDRESYGDILVLHATTAGMQNPRISRKFLEKKFKKDPEAFERESLARFVDSISGFLAPSLLKEAVEKGHKEREPLPRRDHPEDETPVYVAALDPAFRNDAFGFTILHRSREGRVVQDLIRRWKREPGDPPLNPATILAEIAELLATYRVHFVYSDQYQLESLQQLSIQLGFHIEGVDFTARSKARILGNLQQLVNQKKITLLDNPEQLSELASLEKKLTPTGGVQIAAPRGRHDDLAMVLALAARQAIWMFSTDTTPQLKTKTTFDKCMATIKRNRHPMGGGDDW
jgi:hypothetical protein